ncbi:MAG: ABC transporter ATP-binding protein/permease [Actinomycetota bacterium]|nr:ABC transporter ATP-binding protein/permease [Actinomycetota bacterium]
MSGPVSGADSAIRSGRHRNRATAGSVLGASFRKRRSQLWRLGAWSAVEALPALLSGLLVALAVDEGFLAGRLTTGFTWLGVLAVSVVVGAWGTSQALRRLAAVVEPFRDELVSGVVTDALRRSTGLGGHPADGEVARLTQQVEIVREAYASVLIVVQQFVVVTVGALIGLMALAPSILLLVLPPLALALGVFVVVLRRMAVQQRASILADERISATASTVGSGLRDIAACGGQDRAQTLVGRHVDQARTATAAVSRLTGVATIAVAIGGWVPLILILALGPWLIDRGATVGVLLGAATYVLQGLQPALQTLVDGLSGPGLWLMVTLKRLVETGGAGPSTGDRSDPGSQAPRDQPADGRQELLLTGVTFAYSDVAQPVVHGLDLFVPEGDHLAIVGPSGAGKSTLAGLMTGLLAPQSGEISLGGIGLRGATARQLADKRVLIPQEAYVFAGTVRENLDYLAADVSDEQLEVAVWLLGAGPLVAQLGGYGAELDPSTLSAGERQLLTLVRAYVSPAAVVILDEATCHLDPAAEARVEHAFADRPGSLIVIAHRMSSALRAGRILVLDGTDVTLGQHHDLLRRSALYRDLVGHWNVPVEAGR